MSETAPRPFREIQMLDVRLRLTAGRDDWFTLLDNLYSAPEFSPGAAGVEVSHDFGSGGADGPGEPPAAGSDPALMVAEWAFRALLGESRAFHLVHAGALAHGDDGVLVVGPPFAGKTTLTLALVEAGLRYLSDDVGAIARTDGRLHPFRRRAGVRLPEGGRRYVMPGAAGDDPGAPPAPCRLRWLFILEAPRAPSTGQAGAWTLILDSRLQAEAERLRLSQDIRVIAESPWGGGMRLDFAAAPGAVVGRAIESVLGKAGEGILYLGPTPRTWAPGPGTTPRVTDLAAAEASGEVMRHLLNRAGKDDLASRYGRHPHLKMLGEVIGWLAGVHAFRVAAGTPDATAGAIKSLIAGRG